jgi:hypothetical protein
VKSYKLKLAFAAIGIFALAAMTDAATSLRTGASSHPAAPLAASKAPSALSTRAVDTTRIANLYGKIPLTFERNDGQTDSQVKFLSRGPGYTLFLTERSAVLAIKPGSPEAKTTPAKADMTARKTADTKFSLLRVDLAGSKRPRRIEGEDLQGSVSNYFIGKDKAKWRSAVANYGRVKYEGVYPGIDLAYRGNPSQLEYDFTVAPGADPRAIELEFEGADKLSINRKGDLEIALGKMTVVEHAPVVYQEIGGNRRVVAGRYALKGKNRAAFRIAQYDRARPLVIDPTLAYSTYLGCCENLGYTFVGEDMTVDPGGSAYVTGSISSASFPTTLGAYSDGSSAGFGLDVFVSKLTPDGSALVYSTYFGAGSLNSGDSYGDGIAVDADGNAYVTGYTSSTDFPTTAGAFQTILGGGANAFVTKLNPAGTGLVYSTYLGGNNGDGGVHIAVDSSDNAYVTGFAQSSNFPTTPGAFQTTLGGPQNAFVTELNPNGSGLVYSTFLGGNWIDGGDNIVVDSSGNAYVTGYTVSSNFPTTAGAFQTIYNGGCSLSFCGDAFVTKLNSNGTGLVYSTYLGGTSDNGGNGIAIDANGNAYVSGYTNSSDFPVTAGAFQTSFQGGCDPLFCGDGFVTKLNPTGSGLVYSTYFGGSGADVVARIAVDDNGNAYLGGDTESTNLPITTDAYQSTYGGGCSTNPATCLDGFVANLSADGTQLLYSTYFGGTTGALGMYGMALDSESDVFIAGLTGASDLPTTGGSFQPNFNASSESNPFVAKLQLANTGTGSNTQVQVTTGNPVITSGTLTFFVVNGRGVTTMTTSGTGPALPPNYSYGSQPTQVDVNTTASFTGGAGLCFNYDPSQFGDPSLLRLLHLENGTWLDVTTSNDTTDGIICGAVSSFSPFAVAQGPSSAGQPLTIAGVAPKLGLGTAAVGDTLIKSVAIKNTGHTTLFVDGVSSTNPAEFAPTASPCPPAGIAPSQSCSIPINFTPVGVGTRSATLTLTDNTGAGSQNVALSGTGTIDATVRPSTFSIYYTKFGTKVVKAVTILNRQTNAVSLNEFVSGPNAADFAITGGTCGSSLAAKTACSIYVTYKPGILGAESAQLKVTDKPDSLGPYDVSFNVAGTIPEMITPLNLSYGSVSQASSKTLKEIVTNKSPFTISTSSSTSGPNASDFTIVGGTCTGTLAANSSCTVAVKFQPTSASAESATLAVTVPQDPTSPHNVNLTGTGM